MSEDPSHHHNNHQHHHHHLHQFESPVMRRNVNRCGCNHEIHLYISVSSLIWIASCLGTTVLLLTMMFSKAWISSPKQFGVRADGSIDVHVTPYRHTVGPWWVCTNYDLIVVNLQECDLILGRLQPDKLPPAWTLAGTLFLVASLLAVSGAVSSICSMFCQNCLCEHKSVFSITGIIYGFVGIFLVGGFVSFAMGCSHPAVQSETFCGTDSFLLFSGKCTLSWSFYLSLLTVVLCMSAALFSPLVENSVTLVPCPCTSCAICETQEPLMPFPTAESLRLFYDAYEPTTKTFETNIDGTANSIEYNTGPKGHNKVRVKALSLNDYEFVRVPNSVELSINKSIPGISGSQTFTSLHVLPTQAVETNGRPCSYGEPM